MDPSEGLLDLDLAVDRSLIAPPLLRYCILLPAGSLNTAWCDSLNIFFTLRLAGFLDANEAQFFCYGGSHIFSNFDLKSILGFLSSRSAMNSLAFFSKYFSLENKFGFYQIKAHHFHHLEVVMMASEVDLGALTW